MSRLIEMPGESILVRIDSCLDRSPFDASKKLVTSAESAEQHAGARYHFLLTGFVRPIILMCGRVEPFSRRNCERAPGG